MARHSRAAAAEVELHQVPALRQRLQEGEPAASGQAATGGRVVPRLRTARHSELGPGIGVQLRSLRAAFERRPRAPEHGRQGALGRQRDRGALVQVAEIGMREDRGVRDAEGIEGNHRRVHQEVQQPQAARVVGLRDAGVMVLFRNSGAACRIGHSGFTFNTRFCVQPNQPLYTDC